MFPSFARMMVWIEQREGVNYKIPFNAITLNNVFDLVLPVYFSFPLLAFRDFFQQFFDDIKFSQQYRIHQTLSLQAAYFSLHTARVTKQKYLQSIFLNYFLLSTNLVHFFHFNFRSNSCYKISKKTVCIKKKLYVYQPLLNGSSSTNP